MAKIYVDDKILNAQEGDNLLKVCLENGIYIPNLCFLKQNKDNPIASCRMCFVEIEGLAQPVTACTQKVYDGMRVKTDTEEVRRLQKWGIELLLSTQEDPENLEKENELRKIAEFLNVPLKHHRLKYIPRETNIDFNTNAHPYIKYDFKKCILCGKCVEVCKKLNKDYHIDFGKRGYNTVITFFEKREISDSHCKGCGACVKVCPVNALELKNKKEKVTM